MKRFSFLSAALLICCTMLFAQHHPQVTSWENNSEKISFELSNGRLDILPLADNAVRVKYTKEAGRELPELLYLDSLRQSPSYKVKDKKGCVRVDLKHISAVVDKATGQATFLDEKGNVLFSESAKSLTESTVQGEKTYCAELKFNSPEDEYQFGLGQFQDGYLNVKGLTRRLTQVNTQISIPFLLSSKGYGLLWNNYGLTDFNPADQKVVFSKQGSSGEQQVVSVTSTEGSKQEVRQENAFVATLKTSKAGRYALLLDVGQAMARKHHLQIDGKTIVDVKNIWLPPTTSVIVNLEAGEHQLTSYLEKDDKPVLYYKEVEPQTVLRSPVAGAVDFTVFAGKADDIIGSYRALTGNAPMLPDWALGYIHCRERFHSQEELMQTARRFRKEGYPVDLMVQDWLYWGKYGWNAMQFDEDTYPDPKAMVDELHKMNARLMISVWSKINQESKVGKEMTENNFFIPNTSWVDFFNPKAAECYWKNFSNNLLKPYGIDAWWQDATEPENDDLVGRKVINNTVPGEFYRNVYPLYVNKTVYQGSRKDAPNHRTMILTRSGFSGMQRYATAVWSGDVGHDWETLRRQIASGLNTMAAGLPWWTYDAGGFFRPGDQYTNREYHEVFLRWLQTSAFLPLMRVHGYYSDTEFWNYGKEVECIARKSLELRYRLFPYIYSRSAAVSFNGSTLMRPMVMDFSDDPEALAQNYQFMFGPSLLVAPIVEADPKEWKVYLPRTEGGWYDFRTGRKTEKAHGYISVPATLEDIPVFVKAGSILPLSTGGKHVKEAAANTWEIVVYTGADGAFDVYEDEGTNYNYEQGKYATFRIEWNQKKGRLTLHPRKGSFPGMLQTRNMKAVIIDGNGKALEKNIVYDGNKTVITL